ncbi:MAG TPA: family 10 glycosylhydrolase [Phycisphaerae bacterium]|nr:family 10 glycosylhydrolase [Phycisphaerales bacterium]HRX85449.1 family 10 glycosylhydrolase [Phycisphaerae bacterium]
MSRHTCRLAAAAIGTFTLIALLPGCQQAQRRQTGPIRAVWVTRYDYKTPTDVARVMENCKRAGFNTVLFQVRGNGTVAYPSRIEPWSEDFGFRDPGFDPLALAVGEAHRRGLALHAWVNVMPAWRGDAPPPVRNQLYHTHPDWFLYDAARHRQPLVHVNGAERRKWYVSLNPCLPEVRNYLTAVMHEIVSRYPVDGLHLDYIRFPIEPIVSGERVPDYPRDPHTLALFNRETGSDPKVHPAAWKQWRADQVTRLVAQIREMCRKTRPGVMVSAAVKPTPDGGLPYFQDTRRWVAHGVVDAIFPMNYTSSPNEYAARNAMWMALPRAPGVMIVPGVNLSENAPPRQAARIARTEMEQAAHTAGHFSVFAYSLLFERTPGAQTASAGRTPTPQEERRREIIPFMHWLGEYTRNRGR